jgi:hypothetical protein
MKVKGERKFKHRLHRLFIGTPTPYSTGDPIRRTVE